VTPPAERSAAQSEPWAAWLLEITGATAIAGWAQVISLWGGYGRLLRIRLVGAPVPSVILKWVEPPAGTRGGASHLRKVESYDVESAFYRLYAAQCGEHPRVARHLGQRVGDGQWLLALEDLDAAGYPRRIRNPRGVELEACLDWLAAPHARFVGVTPRELWREGTYWHLDTRREELAAISGTELYRRAPELDRRLTQARFRTLVHGDAKPANFCFSEDGRRVAAVDFQYVGGGTGMRDVAYLLDGGGSRTAEARSLDFYFERLRALLPEGVDAAALEAEWRGLYPVAVEDFHRFLAGWRG
jgi:hypothetical protein